MKHEDKLLIERYLYAVVRALPEKRRSDIELELKTLIYDEVEAKNKSVETILLELGDPKSLAVAYTGKQRALIGAHLIDPYKKVLQVMIIVALIAVTVALVFEGLTLQAMTFSVFLGHLLETLLMTAVNVFAFVTLIFIAIEYFDASEEESETFSLKSLPELPEEGKGFSVVETLFNLVLIVVVFTLINVSPSLFSIFSYRDGEWESVRLFDMDVFARFTFLMNITLAIAAFKQFIKFYFKTKTTAYVTWNLPLLVLSTALFIVVINQPNMINSELNQMVQDIGVTNLNVEQIVRMILWVISGVLVLSAGYEIYQDLRLMDRRYINKK